MDWPNEMGYCVPAMWIKARRPSITQQHLMLWNSAVCGYMADNQIVGLGDLHLVSSTSFCENSAVCGYDRIAGLPTPGHSRGGGENLGDATNMVAPSAPLQLL